MNTWWGRHNRVPMRVPRPSWPCPGDWTIRIIRQRFLMSKRSPSSRRNPRRKSGSIMIMVVALLVLMALMGTAYIATARYDRGGAQQNQNNVQIDLLVQSVANMCKTTVAGDLWDGNDIYRPVPREPYSPISSADATALA